MREGDSKGSDRVAKFRGFYGYWAARWDWCPRKGGWRFVFVKIRGAVGSGGHRECAAGPPVAHKGIRITIGRGKSRLSYAIVGPLARRDAVAGVYLELMGRQAFTAPIWIPNCETRTPRIRQC